MQKTLLRLLFLLLLSLQGSLFAMDEAIIIESAGMSENAIIEGYYKLEQELQERKKKIEQLQVTFKDTDTIVITMLDEGNEYKDVVSPKDPEYNEAVKKYKNRLNEQIKRITCASESITIVLSAINEIAALSLKQQDYALTKAYVDYLDNHREWYESILTSALKDQEFYEKKDVMTAIPAENPFENNNDS